MQTSPVERLARALEDGLAHAELSGVALTLVSGADARSWLHDLVTTDVETLDRNRARPSLLLTPTGRIRASFHVLGLTERDVLLAQPVDAPEPIGEALAPYVLSSDVTLRPSSLRIVALPGRDRPPPWAREAWWPSVLGGGLDLLVEASDDEALEDVRERLADEGLEPADAEAVEVRRIRRGDPRYPIDLEEGSLPAEAGWDVSPVTDRTKGCFLGQEAIAKVANLGHPARTILPIASGVGLRAGEAVVLDGREVGRITSAAGSEGFARVAWDARDAPIATVSGTRLHRRARAA